MAIAQYVIKYILNIVLEECIEELKYLEKYRLLESKHEYEDEPKNILSIIEQLQKYATEPFKIISHYKRGLQRLKRGDDGATPNKII